MNPEPPSILVCRCALTGVTPPDRIAAVVAALEESGRRFETVPDLCALVAQRDPALLEWSRRPGLKIVACYPRALAGLFAAAGAPLPASGIELLNLRELDPAAALRQLGVDEPRTSTPNIQHSTFNVQPPPPSVQHPASSVQSPASNDQPPPSSLPPSSVQRPASSVERPASSIQHPASSTPSIRNPQSAIANSSWFPVIDRARCTACGQCKEFCLFGVYTAEDGRIEVRNPLNCKDHCPACARICPQAAIIFPKHEEAPINGADITDEEAEQARIRRDLHALLGDDLDAALAERKRRARARLIDPAKLQKARDERARHGAAGETGT